MSDLSQIPTEQLVHMLQENQSAPPPVAPKKERFIPGDAGSLMSAGDAYHAITDLWDRTAYGAGGKISDAATNAGASPNVAAGLGFVGNVGMQAGPALLGGKAVEKLASPAMESMGRMLMKSAVKPPLADQLSGDAAKGIETMLREGYNPTKGGVEAMQQKISQLGEEISATIKNSNATVSKGDVGTSLMDAYKKFRNQVNPEADLNAIKQAWLEFRNHPDLIGKTDMPVQLAQQLKQGTYSQLGSKTYGELSGASTEAQKQLARGLKEGISKAVPEVAPLNQLQAELINAKSIAERRALMQGNNNPLSLGASLGALGHDPMSTIGLWANSSAFAKSMLARAAYSGAERIPQAAGSSIGAALMAPSGKAPSPQELSEQLRKKKVTPVQQFDPLNPEDASIPLAQR